MKKPTMKKSNARKLVPAVAMLTTSAIMLSTATYAWFTLSKEAEVTGLQMAATTAGGIEISLGDINAPEEGTWTAGIAPDMIDGSWKSQVQIAEYYDSVWKIKPSSSNTGLSLYSVPDRDIFAGGAEVNDNATVSLIDKTQEAFTDSLAISSKTGYDSNAAAITEDADKLGYYMDIPMWIRTSKKEAQNVKCEIVIKDGSLEYADMDDGSELLKAVRVAVIPMSSGLKAADSTGKADAISLTATYTSSGEKIFATDSTSSYYNSGQAISRIGTYSGSLGAVPALLTALSSDTDFDAKKGADGSFDATLSNNTVFNLAAAADGEYSVQGFVVRVWLEGESTFCNDANANQDWNIDLHFAAQKST